MYVQPSARAGWEAFLEANSRCEDPNIMFLFNIPDGRLPEPVECEEGFYAPHQGPQWPNADGIDVLKTPLESPAFVEQYLQTKLEKHQILLTFIENVDKVGFSREAHKMLTAVDVPRLTHVLKYVPKDASSTGWMKMVDDAHLST